MKRPIARLLVGLLAGLAAATSLTPTGPARADTVGTPDPVTRASVVSTGQTNVEPGGTLTGLVEGSVVHVHSEVSGGQLFGIRARVCRAGLNITTTAEFAPTSFGDCIPTPFVSGVDDNTVLVQSSPPNTTVDLDIRVGRGTKVFSYTGGTSTITCDSLHPCSLWLDHSVPTSASPDASGHVWKHFDLAYARRPVVTDYDEDAKTDVSVYRGAEAAWYTSPSLGPPDAATTVGAPGDTPVPGDYDGDLKVDRAVYTPDAPGTWTISNSGGGVASSVYGGVEGDVPVPADYDGDAKTDIAIFRPSIGTWFIDPSSGGADLTLGYGASGDVPVPGDYDGDGEADVAIFRASVGLWAIHNSSGSDTFITFGIPGDIPVPGDYDYDGKTDIAAYRPGGGGWYVHPSSGAPDTGFAYGGVAGDVPVPGDYDGDGKTDIAVFRSSTGLWAIKHTTGGETLRTFGVSDDIALPLPAAIHQAYS